MINKQNNKV